MISVNINKTIHIYNKIVMGGGGVGGGGGGWGGGGSGWWWSGFSGVLTACRRVTWERRRCKCNTSRQHKIQVCGSLGHLGTRLELVDSKWCHIRPPVSHGCRDSRNNDWTAVEVYILGWMLNAQRNQQLESLTLCFWECCADNDLWHIFYSWEWYKQ